MIDWVKDENNTVAASFTDERDLDGEPQDLSEIWTTSCGTNSCRCVASRWRRAACERHVRERFGGRESGERDMEERQKWDKIKNEYNIIEKIILIKVEKVLESWMESVSEK